MIRTLFVLMLLVALPAQASESFLSWKDASGAAHFTDDLAKVPAAYRSSVKDSTWSALHEKTDKKVTLAEKSNARRRTVEADAPQQETSACGFPMTRDLAWVTKGEYTRRMVRTFDSCGQLLDEDFAGYRH